MKRILMITSVLLALTGCIKDEFLITNDQTMGNVIDGRFISDQGIWYDVVEQTCEGNLASCERALVVSDILKNTSSGSEYSYEIRLKQFIPVDLPEVIADTTGVTQNPVLVDYVWPSGGYLNLRLNFNYVATSKVEHKFKIGLLQKPSYSDPLIVFVCHDAGGEYYGSETTISSTLTSVMSFVSIPISSYYPVGDEVSSDYIVVYPWHKTAEDGETLLPETEIYQYKGNFYR